ncbi:MAG: hypothetical protein ACR2KP_17145 [Egibacteraceae bacterium]
MTAPCGRAHCPVAAPDTDLLAQLSAVPWPADERLHRGHRLARPADELVPGVGDTRFAPLADLHHTYLSRSRTAGLLESALHELSGADPTIYLAILDGWGLTEVTLRASVSLADLRNPELDRIGVTRDRLVDTDPLHYPCTREWAGEIAAVRSGDGPVDGMLWHSRQADLHARSHQDGLLGDLLTHRATEVAVMWRPPTAAALLDTVSDTEPLVHAGRPARLVVELSAITGAPIA